MQNPLGKVFCKVIFISCNRGHDADCLKSIHRKRVLVFRVDAANQTMNRGAIPDLSNHTPLPGIVAGKDPFNKLTRLVGSVIFRIVYGRGISSIGSK